MRISNVSPLWMSALLLCIIACGGVDEPISARDTNPNSNQSNRGPDEENDDDDQDGNGNPTLPITASCAGLASSTGTVIGPLGPMQAVGDSIMGYHKEVQASIADVVGQQLGVEMINHATGGAELRNNGIGDQYQSGRFSHVLITGGGNDFARACSPAALDGIISPDLQQGLMVDLVNRITTDGAQAVIMSYYLPRDQEIGCNLFVELLTRYRKLGETRNDVMYVCAAETITPAQPNLYADPVHPSIEGSAALGQLIAHHLRP